MSLVFFKEEEVYSFKEGKTYSYFIAECIGWFKTLNVLAHKIDEIIELEQYRQNRELNCDVHVHLVKVDSYFNYNYITFRISLSELSKLSQDNKIAILSQFKSSIESLPALCVHCGSLKDIEDINSSENSDMLAPEITQDDLTLPSSYQITVHSIESESCRTCRLSQGEEFYIHVFNSFKLNNNSSFPNSKISGRLIPFNEPLKIRVIEKDDHFLILDEKCFVFYPTNTQAILQVYYREDIGHIKDNDLINIDKDKTFLKAQYAGHFTGHIDVLDKRIFTGDIVRYRRNKHEDHLVECCAVVAFEPAVNEYCVIGNYWMKPLNELLEIEVIGNIYFQHNTHILSYAKNVGEYGFQDSNCSLFEVDKVKMYLSSKKTPKLR